MRRPVVLLLAAEARKCGVVGVDDFVCTPETTRLLSWWARSPLPDDSALRRQVAATDVTTGPRYGFVRGITLYDASGTAIARATDLHEVDAHPTLASYPSLAVALEKDLR